MLSLAAVAPSMLEPSALYKVACLGPLLAYNLLSAASVLVSAQHMLGLAPIVDARAYRDAMVAEAWAAVEHGLGGVSLLQALLLAPRLLPAQDARQRALQAALACALRNKEMSYLAMALELLSGIIPQLRPGEGGR